MFDALWGWAGPHLMFGLACTAVGALLFAPMMLSRRFRRWFARSDIDLEHIGFAVLLVLVLCIGMSNYFSSAA